MGRGSWRAVVASRESERRERRKVGWRCRCCERERRRMEGVRNARSPSRLRREAKRGRLEGGRRWERPCRRWKWRGRW